MTVKGKVMASLEDFYHKNMAFMSDWLRKKGQEKLCDQFEGKYEMLTVFQCSLKSKDCSC